MNAKHKQRKDFPENDPTPPIGGHFGYETVKRAVDLAVAVPLLVATLPLQVAVGGAVRASLGSPVFFRQPRTGRFGKTFTLIKFRTMREVNLTLGFVDDASRLGRVGRWLRASSLDELPTLWNVVMGDMSLVGPRPFVTRYLARYSRRHARRHSVKPGLTGWAQVNGHNSLSWFDRFEYDIEYVERRSLWFDFKILAKSAGVVLTRRGVSPGGPATKSEFLGYAPNL